MASLRYNSQSSSKRNIKSQHPHSKLSYEQLCKMKTIDDKRCIITGLPECVTEQILYHHNWYGKFEGITKIEKGEGKKYNTTAWVFCKSSKSANQVIDFTNNAKFNDHRRLRATPALNKYCHHFLNNQHCISNVCGYAHRYGKESKRDNSDFFRISNPKTKQKIAVDPTVYYPRINPSDMNRHRYSRKTKLLSGYESPSTTSSSISPVKEKRKLKSDMDKLREKERTIEKLVAELCKSNATNRDKERHIAELEEQQHCSRIKLQRYAQKVKRLRDMYDALKMEHVDLNGKYQKVIGKVYK